jgi:hypothetical protein
MRSQGREPEMKNQEGKTSNEELRRRNQTRNQEQRKSNINGELRVTRNEEARKITIHGKPRRRNKEPIR